MWPRSLLLFVVLAASVTTSAPLGAQETPDTAAVLIQVVRQLQAEREWDTAEELLRYIMRHYARTPAAADAERLLGELRGIRTATSGRTNFIVSQTLFGAWLGIAIPLAIDEEPSETAFGLGLLLGAPAGFLWSSAYSRKNSMSRGQASTINFAQAWGTWQFIGWQQVLGIGDGEVCDADFCYTDESQTAPFVAGGVGGLAGLGTGLFLTRRSEIPEGDAELVNHAALWGSWYGLTLSALFAGDDEPSLAATLLAGDIALAAAIPAAIAWRPTPGRVRLVSISGLAGLIGGLGLDLLLSVDDDKTAILLPTLSSTAGLALGYLFTRPSPAAEEASVGFLSGALLNVDDGVRLNVPLPTPTPMPYETPAGKREWRPGFRLTLLRARF